MDLENSPLTLYSLEFQGSWPIQLN